MGSPLPAGSHPARSKIALTGVALLAAVLSACGTPTGAGLSTGTVPGESSSHSIVVHGLTRTFTIYRPEPVATGGAMPLVVFLHGGFGSSGQAEKAYG